MKNNTLKIIIAIGMVVISLSIGYYFLFFLPKLQHNELILKKQIECQKDGMILYEKDMKGVDIPFVPVFKFSPKLNTCLYESGWLAGNMISWFIKDVYSNKELVNYMYETGKEDMSDHVEFEQQERILLEE